MIELVVQLYYKDLQSELPSKVRCSNPGIKITEINTCSNVDSIFSLNLYISEGLPVDKVRIKQAFLSLPVAEAFQNLFLDQNIEQG